MDNAGPWRRHACTMPLLPRPVARSQQWSAQSRTDVEARSKCGVRSAVRRSVGATKYVENEEHRSCIRQSEKTRFESLSVVVLDRVHDLEPVSITHILCRYPILCRGIWVQHMVLMSILEATAAFFWIIIIIIITGKRHSCSNACPQLSKGGNAFFFQNTMNTTWNVVV